MAADGVGHVVSRAQSHPKRLELVQLAGSLNLASGQRDQKLWWQLVDGEVHVSFAVPARIRRLRRASRAVLAIGHAGQRRQGRVHPDEAARQCGDELELRRWRHPGRPSARSLAATPQIQVREAQRQRRSLLPIGGSGCGRRLDQTGLSSADLLAR
jgi:hypothetical protein